MTSFDVRNSSETIDEIRFADKNVNRYSADVLRKNSPTIGGINIADSDSTTYMEIRDRYHAENLIKALNKSIELGWI